ncbi:hypothetical protein [uncultured Kordia sp.]|uniref:hypothetical protein n=1 Tax=uncultured Kordia sp. TaxID=507699 RepID=UPI002609B823|nr:hypothetical protein [uncultured Kordia sp.]
MWVNTFCVQYLSDTAGGTGGGGSTGTIGGGNPNPNTPTEEPIEFPTIPFEIPDPDHQKNCAELALNASNASFTGRMQELSTATEGSIEKGFGIYNGSYATPATSNPVVGVLLNGTTQNGPNIPYHPFQKGIAHNHLNNPIYKHIGVFSPKDMQTLNNLVSLTIQQSSHVKKHELVSYLVCNEGNYALKISDDTKLYNFALKYATNAKYRRTIEKFYNDNNITHGKTKNDQNKGFLKLLKDEDIGVRFYEADANYQNWKELILDKSGAIIENPC